MYAALMSISNAGSGAAGLVAAGVIPLLGISATNFKYLWLLLVLLMIPNLLSLLCLPHLPRLAMGEVHSKQGDADAVADESTPRGRQESI